MKQSLPVAHAPTLISDAEYGLGHDEFFFVLQPKMRLRENTLSGFEYLIRWRHPTGGVLAPAFFLSVVEDSSLTGRFTDLLITRAATMLKRWKTSGNAHLSVAVNMSAPELGRKDLPDRLSHLFASLEIDPGRFEIELTDAVHPDRLDWLVEVIHAVQTIGVRVALDDFGSGFNSLTLLQQLPVDIVKFDRTFIQQVSESEESKDMIEALVRLAQNHGKQIVLKGLETAQQYSWARTLLNLEGQGFYICEPLSESGIDDFIARHRGSSPG